VTPRLARWLLALAAVPPAYACFLYGWQVVGFTGFAVRLDEALPADAWWSIAASGLGMAAIAISLFIVWRCASRRRFRAAGFALLACWVIAAPLLVPALLLPLWEKVSAAG
jgi:hypothetical protein